MAAEKNDFQLMRAAQNGDRDAMNQILRQYMPVIKKEARKKGMGRAPIPPMAILGEGIRLAVSAINSFDNTKGAAFETHLTSNLRALQRYINTNKRIDRVPDNKNLQLPKYRAVKALLKAEKGREPTRYEMSDALGWPVSQVMDLEKALTQGTYAASGLNNIQDQQQAINDRLKETVDMSYYTWPAEKQLVFDYTFGMHGKQMLEVPQIIKETGLSQAKVYRIRKQLQDELR